MRGVIVGVVLGALVFSGCAARSVATSTVVWGPYPREDPRALFDTVVSRVRSRGYAVLDADATAGHFAVRSNQNTRWGRAVFRFRFYRGGWVAVEVAGGGGNGGEGAIVLPTPLYEEYADLVHGLLESPMTEEDE